MIPDIKTSTREEREAYIQKALACRSDCDNCGLCKIFRGTEPVIAYEDYIEGKASYFEVSQRWRSR